jgi:hypothetical protein
VRIAFRAWGGGELIPVEDRLPARKLAKYLSRESAAAVVVVSQLFDAGRPDPRTPIFYATGTVEHEDFGLAEMLAASRDRDGAFSRERFLAEGITQVSPLSQFKVLYNMPLCFLSIFFGLTGDNAVLYGPARGLLDAAQLSGQEGPVLIGAGKVFAGGAVAAGFALGTREEFAGHGPAPSTGEAVDLLRTWAEGG